MPRDTSVGAGETEGVRTGSDAYLDMWGKPLAHGDDVVVYFPSGNEAEGRFVRPSRGRALVSVADGSRLYPFGWLSGWGDAPEHGRRSDPSILGLSDTASGSVPDPGVPGVASLPAFNREHGGERDGV